MLQWFIRFSEFSESSGPFRKTPLCFSERDKLPINVPSNLTGKNCLFTGTSEQNQNVGTTDKSLMSCSFALCPACGVENKNSICFKLTALSWFDLIYWLPILVVFSYYGPHIIHINPPVSHLIRITLLHIWWKDDGTDMNWPISHISCQISMDPFSLFQRHLIFCYDSDPCVIVDCKYESIVRISLSKDKKKSENEEWLYYSKKLLGEK